MRKIDGCLQILREEMRRVTTAAHFHVMSCHGTT